jgi:hypothetical protein
VFHAEEIPVDMLGRYFSHFSGNLTDEDMSQLTVISSPNINVNDFCWQQYSKSIKPIHA